MFDADATLLEAIQLLEAAKLKIETIRAAKVEEAYDGRALIIAVTHLETSQLWRFIADVTIRCIQCSEPFRFLGHERPDDGRESRSRPVWRE